MDQVDLLEAPRQAAEGGERGEVDVELVPAGELGAVVGGDGEPADGEGTRCLLYTSDAADDLLCVDLGGRRTLKKQKHNNTTTQTQLSDVN